MNHMEAEERELFPLVDTAHPVEVARMRAEHAQIRQLVSELGLAIELHVARQPGIEGLAKLLRAHAGREDDFLYEFAGAEAPPEAHDRIGSVLRAGRHAIVGRKTASLDSNCDAEHE